MSARALLVAKAPIPGRAKTRLGAAIGMESAAEIAAAALLDCIEVCARAFDGDCALALDGDLGAAVAAGEISAALRGWQVFAQTGDGFGARLAAAHAGAARPGAAVVQVGMDTPQMTVADLRAAAAAADAEDHAGLGLAADGGWWVLALRRPEAAGALRAVPMSTPDTGTETEEALRAAGLRVRRLSALRDIDTVADAEAVAAGAPATRFAAAWARRAKEISA